MKAFSTILLSLAFVSCQAGAIDRFLVDLFRGTANTESTAQGENIPASQKETDATPSVPQDAQATNIGLPAHSPDDIIIERTAYTTSYDAAHKVPKWVAWQLTADHTEGTQKRLSNFIVDESVPAPRAELIDYKGSGYDRGHMCPAGDNKWAFEPMRESFFLTNICPQDRNLNSGDWNELEVECRTWASRFKEVYIVAGPIFYTDAPKIIGPNKVAVPDAFFKVVLSTTGTPKAIGFIYKNEPCNNAMAHYAMSVDEVEQITGLDFFAALDDATESKVESMTSLNAWR